MKALFLDQSTTTTGFCVAEPGHLITHGTSRLTGKHCIQERILTLYRDVCTLLDQHEGIDTMVLEDNRFPQPSRDANYAMNGAMAACHIAATERGVHIGSLTPSEIKTAATGSGRATKEDMVEAAMRIWGLTEEPNHNTADALCLAFAWYVQEGLWK